MDCVASTGINSTDSSAAAAAPWRRTRAPTPGGFVTHSRFLVANGMEPEVKAAFRARHRGHGYRESHCGLPKGLKRVGCKTCLRGFEVVCE
jgi:hypothetical protein